MKRKPPSLDKPYQKHRPVSQEEKELWNAAMDGKIKKAVEQAIKEPGNSKALKIAERKPSVHPSARLPDPALDSSTRIRLKRGILAIEATLDLHGYTQVTAHAALIEFVARAQAKNIRLVLVITGKGRIGGGTLREALPRWLEESPLRDCVMAYNAAGPRHGGGGAWYIKIRRLQPEG